MLPDLTGNVSILALSNRQPRQHFTDYVIVFLRICAGLRRFLHCQQFLIGAVRV
jgi:hypothetical protein